MNERIRQLAEQAGIKEHPAKLSVYKEDDGTTSTKWEYPLAKFAELIVKECLVEFYRQYFDDSNGEDITVQVERYAEDLFRGDARLDRIEAQLRQQAHELRNRDEP